MEQSAFGRPDIVATARLIEAANLSTAEGIVAASAELRDFIVQEYGVDSSTVHVVPNGVSKEGFARPWGGANWRKSLGLSDQDLLAIHAAPPGYTANDLSVDFLGEVVQQIMSKRLRIKTVLTGRTTSPDGIHPLGVVDDYYGLVDAADVALLPYPPRAICGGTRNKALDFLARGKAIVSTSEGMRGLGEIRDGVHYIRAETPRDFVDALQLLGGNPLLRATLGETAKEIAAQNFWSARAEQLLRIFGNKRSAT